MYLRFDSIIIIYNIMYSNKHVNSTVFALFLQAVLFQGGGSDVVSVRCFGVRVSVVYRFMFVHHTFSSVWFAEWPPFGK